MSLAHYVRLCWFVTNKLRTVKSYKNTPNWRKNESQGRALASCAKMKGVATTWHNKQQVPKKETVLSKHTINSPLGGAGGG